MNSIRLFSLVAVLAVFSAPSAHAHAFLDHADPRVGSTVAISPRIVKLWFTEDLEPSKNTVKVFDSAGKEIDNNDTRLDSDDTTELTVSVPELTNDTYTVKWSVIATDTHHTTGTFKFTVHAHPTN